MTKEQLMIRLRNTREVEQLKQEYHALTGGVLSVDTLHQDDCKGCPANSLCGCVVAHPELYKQCQQDHKGARQGCGERALYAATCHAGAEHIMIPLHVNGEVAGYLRSGGLVSPHSLEKFAKMTKSQCEKNDLSVLKKIEEQIDYQRNREGIGSSQLFVWLTDKASDLDTLLSKINSEMYEN